MHIANWDIKELLDSVEISAEVDNFRLWYRLPKSYPVSRAGDPFLAAALLPAMLQGEKIEIDTGLPVSPKLLKNLLQLQEIHHCWNPLLKIVPINARAFHAEPINVGAMSFFSGGVDSTYTFLKRIDEISHVVFIQGFDFYVNSEPATEFSVGDLADLSQLAFKLTLPWDAVSAFLRDSLSKSTMRAMSSYGSSGFVPPGLEPGLSDDLAQIIHGPLIYETQRFARVKLSTETSELLTKNPQGNDLSSLNRLLLEDAYPLEIARKHSSIYQTAIARNTQYVKTFGKTLIPVSTNHFPFGYRYNLSRNLTQGSALASIALLLGFTRVYLPSAYSYNQLIPLGSHPLTDPLWSNEGVDIIHEGAEARRVDKVIRIAESEPALANLRVCFDDMNSNCGKCSKCLRTMIPLKLLRASAAPFPPLPPLKSIRKMRIGNEIEMIFFKENFDVALQTENEELLNALSASLKRFEQRQLLKEIDRVLWGGLIKRARQRKDKGIKRIDTSDRENNKSPFLI